MILVRYSSIPIVLMFAPPESVWNGPDRFGGTYVPVCHSASSPQVEDCPTVNL